MDRPRFTPKKEPGVWELKDLRMSRGGILHDLANARPELFADGKEKELKAKVDQLVALITYADNSPADELPDTDKKPF